MDINREKLKICCRCRESHPILFYHRDKSRKDGRNPLCKSCRSEESKKYSRSDYNKEYFKSDNGRYVRYVYMLKYYYDLSEDEFRGMLDKTMGICPVCLRSFTYNNKGTKISVDHCHSTNTIRGLLCSDCNAGLGKIGDTYESSLRLLQYLEVTNDSLQVEE